MRAIITLEQALKITHDEALRGAAQGTETVALGDALGRVLARPIVSTIDSPPFDKSAMDGFALAAGDASTELRIRETVAAGAAAGRPLGPGECARIMTGAMLPPGSDRVVRKEYVEERAGIVRLIRPEPGDNVVRRAANLRRGQVVLGPKVIAAQDIGILAASGVGRPEVVVPPSAGIICTGPEIVAPGGTLGPGRIYDSNGPQLAAQLAAMHCSGRQRGIVPDEPDALSTAIAAALEENEVVLLTGGVSEGDFDYVPRCLEELGAEILYHGVGVKPGKPTLLARREEKRIFGLPGNPVSTFVIFEVFVKPFLYRRMGIDWKPVLYRGTVGEAVRRRIADRAEFLPVRVDGGVVRPVAFHGSAHLDALGGAHGLILLAPGVTEIPPGEQVDVRPL